MRYSIITTILVLFFIFGTFGAAHAAGPTVVPAGVIITNTTWTAEDSPYIVNGTVQVGTGITLTVEAGTVVQFVKGGHSLIVPTGSILNVVGTADNPVRFTSSEATPTPGDWRGLWIRDGAVANLQHCDIAHTGESNWAGLFIDSSATNVQHCRIHHGTYHGVELRGNGLAPTLHDLEIDNNSGHAIHQNTVDMTPDLANLNVHDNGVNAIVFAPGGFFAHTYTLHPYGTAGNEDLPFLFQGGSAVMDGVTLTVEAGTVVQFVKGGHSLNVLVGGTLNILGTADNPVRFTSNEATPAPGDWRGIWILSGATANLQHCDIAHAGANDWAGIEIDTSDVSVRNCRIHDSLADAIVVSSAQPALRYNEIENSGSGLLNITPATVVDARLNWWGDASGPQHPTINPTGQGLPVSNGVLVEPWLRVAVRGSDRAAATTLTAGNAAGATVGSGALADFVYNASAGENLIVTVRPLQPTAAPTLLLHRLGNAPLLVNNLGDDWTDEPVNGAYTIILVDVLPGTHYFTLAPQTTSGSVQYEILVTTQNHYLSSIAPTTAPAAPTWLEARGVFRFARLETVWLCQGENLVVQGTLGAQQPGLALLNFDLTEVANGSYDLCVTWPDSVEQRLTNALQVDATLVGQLATRIEKPSLVRLDRPYMATLVYGNSGTAPIPSPAFAVTAENGTIHPQLGAPAVSALRVLGLGARIPANLLMPGEERRVPFYVVPTSLEHRLGLRTFDASNQEAFPWDVVEAALRPTPAPASWDTKWAAARADFGESWGSVVSRLNALSAPLGADANLHLDDKLRFWLLVMLQEEVTAAGGGDAMPQAVQEEATYLFTFDDEDYTFRYNPEADVSLTQFGGGEYDPNLPTFFITHGNADSIDGSFRYTNVADAVEQKMTQNGAKANIIMVDWNQGASSEGIFGSKDPFAKTRYLNPDGENVLQSAGRAICEKIRQQYPGLQMKDTTFMGHSFGNGINQEIARNCHDGDKPAAIVVNPASTDSGIHISNYGEGFDVQRSVAIHTNSDFDEGNISNLGLHTYNIDNKETPPDYSLSGVTAARHGYGIDTFLPDIMPQCFDPREPRKIIGFLPDEDEEATEEDELKELDFPDQPPVQKKEIDVDVVRSMDPNDKTAWSAYIQPDGTVRYTIRFENVMTATAAAQEVLITDVLDANLDPATVRFVAAGFGAHAMPVPEQSINRYLEVETLVDDPRSEVSSLMQVRLTASVEPADGRIIWFWETLDPDTGLWPADPLAGFLPPNDENGQGEGFVIFEVQPKAGLPLGTVLRNHASIVFDTNEAIVTPEVTTVIGTPPTNVYLPAIIDQP